MKVVYIVLLYLYSFTYSKVIRNKRATMKSPLAMSGKDVTPKALTSSMEEKKRSDNESNIWMVNAVLLKNTLTKEPVGMGPVPLDYKVQRGEISAAVMPTMTDSSESNSTNHNGNAVDARNFHHKVTISLDKDVISMAVKALVDAISSLVLHNPAETSSTESSDPITSDLVPCSIDHLTQVEKISKQQCNGALVLPFFFTVIFCRLSEFAYNVCAEFFDCITESGSSYMDCRPKICDQFERKEKELPCSKSLFTCL